MTHKPPIAASSDPRRALDDFDRFSALSADEKLAIATEIAAELGGDFRAGAGLVGEAQLATLLHVPSRITLVLIPGGTFVIGFTADDQAAVERYFDRKREPDVFAFVEEHMRAMTPAREVRVRPFAITRQRLATLDALSPPAMRARE